MERLKLLQKMYERLALLDKQRYSLDLTSKRYADINIEMAHIRLKVQEIINSKCPVWKDFYEIRH